MRKTAMLVGALALTSVLLAGCSTGGTTAPSSSPTATRAATPVLRVPEKTSDSTVRLIVNGGRLKGGTVATVYRFDSDYGAKATCSSSDAEQQRVTINGDGSDQTVTFRAPDSGVANWVLVAGKYITPCGADDARTTVLVQPDAQLFLSQDRDVDTPVPTGGNETMTVTSDGIPQGQTVDATVTVTGPYETLPAALAADCKTATPAWTGKAPLTYNNGRADSKEVTYTPKKAGVYIVNLSMPETERTAAYDTCESGSGDADGPTTFTAGG